MTNASKTPHPIASDGQLLGLLRKRVAAAQAAQDAFAAGGRADLRDKERAEEEVLRAYVAQVPAQDAAEMRAAVRAVVDRLRAGAGTEAEGPLKLGAIMQALVGPGGSLEGKPVDKAELAKEVQAAI